MLFLKITGSFLVLISCTLLGYSFKFENGNKMKSFENLSLCLKLFETEIRCNLTDIITATKKVIEISDKNNSFIFKTFLDNAKHSEGKPMSEIWAESVKQCEGLTIYNKKDLNIFLKFGTILGSGDVHTQVENIDAFMKNADDEFEEIKSKTRKTDDICAKLGIYAGVLIVIFLI